MKDARELTTEEVAKIAYAEGIKAGKAEQSAHLPSHYTVSLSIGEFNERLEAEFQLGVDKGYCDAVDLAHAAHNPREFEFYVARMLVNRGEITAYGETEAEALSVLREAYELQFKNAQWDWVAEDAFVEPFKLGDFKVIE